MQGGNNFQQRPIKQFFSIKPKILVFGGSITAGMSSESVIRQYRVENRWTEALKLDFRPVIQAVPGRTITIDRSDARFFSALMSFLKANWQGAKAFVFEFGCSYLTSELSVDDTIRRINQVVQDVSQYEMASVFLVHCGVDYNRAPQFLEYQDKEEEFYNKLNMIRCPVVDLRPFKSELIGSNGFTYKMEAQWIVATQLVTYLRRVMERDNRYLYQEEVDQMKRETIHRETLNQAKNEIGEEETEEDDPVPSYQKIMQRFMQPQQPQPKPKPKEAKAIPRPEPTKLEYQYEKVEEEAAEEVEAEALEELAEEAEEGYEEAE